jgi:hypothetical protein
VDQRRIHKIALIGGALLLIGGAVLILREPGAGEQQTETPPTIPPPQTTVQAFADTSVVVPPAGERPKPPMRLDIRASAYRLVIGWGPQRTGNSEPAGAAGYEVRWGQGRRPNHIRFIAEPVIQLDGLENHALYRVEVRTVDSYGQRSEPARGEGMPSGTVGGDGPFTFVDRFDGQVVPDPARWRLAGIGNCTKAARGDADDARRMVISAQCGNSDESVALRSRAPIRLLDKASAPGGELGRVTVLTDRPGHGGELTIDLVPGPADLIGRAPAQTLGPVRPGSAIEDESIPQGAVRVRVAGWLRDAAGKPEPATTVQVLVAPGTAALGRPVAVSPAPMPEISVSVRWEVVLRTDGIRVERDGVVVGGGDVVVSFAEATVLVGFAGGQGGLHAGVDLIGFTGAPTAPPPLMSAPRVDFDREVAGPNSRLQTSASGRRMSGLRAGQLRITLVPQAKLPPDIQFTVDVGGREFPARKAIANQPGLPGVRLPIVADLPPDAVVIKPSADSVAVGVRSAVGENGLPTQVLTAELELTGQSPVRESRAAERPLPRANPRLAAPTVTLRDAAGAPIPALREVARGRLVLDVAMDAAAAQRMTGAVAGLAGVEISMDGRPLAGIRTVADGPGVGGRWAIALNTTEVTPGGHTIQVMAIGSDPTTSYAIAYTSFVIR